MIEAVDWGTVLDGDRVVFGDPPTSYDVARSGDRIAVRPAGGELGTWSAPIAVPAGTPVARLARGATTTAVATLIEAGFAVDILA